MRGPQPLRFGSSFLSRTVVCLNDTDPALTIVALSPSILHRRMYQVDVGARPPKCSWGSFCSDAIKDWRQQDCVENSRDCGHAGKPCCIFDNYALGSGERGGLHVLGVAQMVRAQYRACARAGAAATPPPGKTPRPCRQPWRLAGPAACLPAQPRCNSVPQCLGLCRVGDGLPGRRAPLCQAARQLAGHLPTLCRAGASGSPGKRGERREERGERREERGERRETAGK